MADTTDTVNAFTNASVYAVFNEILAVAEFKENTSANNGKGTVLDNIKQKHLKLAYKYPLR